MIRHALRLTIRAMARDWVVSLAVILALAFGIGATTAVVGLADRALLKPLPFSRPAELVKVWEAQPEEGVERMWVAPPNAEDWRASGVFEALTTFQPGYDVNLSVGTTPERSQGSRVSAEFFQVMGVVPPLGRGFLAGGTEDEGDAVVLSHGLWQRRFEADPEIVGTTIHVNGRPTTVVGVMPEGFSFPAGSELWLPLDFDPGEYPRTAHFLEAVARLPRGTEVGVAQERLSGFVERLAARHPELAGWDVELVPLREELVGGVRTALLVLLATGLVVLLLTSANAGSLFLARILFRQDELAVRSALGASRMRITRERVLESAVLVAVAGVLGVVLALVVTPLLLSWAPATLAPFRLRLDLRLLVTAGSISLLTGILFATWPVLRASRVEVQRAMRRSSRSRAANTRRAFWQDGLIVVNVALSVVLMIGAGLLSKSLLRLSDVDAGFDPAGTVTAELSLPPTAYPDRARIGAFLGRLHDRLGRLPGVHAAGLTTALPTTDSTGGTMMVSREGYEGGREPIEVRFVSVSPDYFDSMGIRIQGGRDFSSRDHSEAPPVAIVSRSLARSLWSAPDVVGRELYLGLGRDAWYEVVAVVDDVRESSLLAPPRPAVYLPLAQYTSTGHVWLTLRSEADPMLLVPGARQVLRELDPELPLYDVQPMSASVAGSIRREHFVARLVGSLALLTLGIGAVGIYGSMAYTVAQRIGEIGVRIALGASPKRVMWDVVRHGLRLTGIGLVLGLVASWQVTHLLQALLYDVDAHDAAVFAVIAAVFLTVGFLACYVPSRRAAHVDPARSLQPA